MKKLKSENNKFNVDTVRLRIKLFNYFNTASQPFKKDNA